MKKILTAMWRVFASFCAMLFLGEVSYAILDKMFSTERDTDGNVTSIRFR